MNCDISKDGLLPLSPGGEFSSLQFVGTGMKIKAEMYQCVEHEHSETTKDKVGGGKTTIKTYTYSKEWRSSNSLLRSQSFHKRNSQNYYQNCGYGDNPPWPSQVPRNGTKYADKMRVGAVITTKTASVPLNTVLNTDTPPGWTNQGGTFQSNSYQTGNTGIGTVRVTFYGNDWANPQVTLLGKNAGGEVVPWKAPPSWLCDGSTLSDLRMGSVDKESLFNKLQSESEALTWILRIVGFLLMWLAFSLCFAPLEVAADCIPCIGPCLGDSIAGITCCISCLPATACAVGIASLMWCVMRPWVGVPVMVLCCAIMCALGHFVATRKSQKQQDQAAPGAALVAGIQNPMYGAAQQVLTSPVPATMVAQPAVAPQAAQPVLAQPVVAQQPRQMQVQVPYNCSPGSPVQVSTPDGTLLQVTIPEGIQPGGVFLVQY